MDTSAKWKGCKPCYTHVYSNVGTTSLPPLTHHFSKTPANEVKSSSRGPPCPPKSIEIMYIKNPEEFWSVELLFFFKKCWISIKENL